MRTGWGSEAGDCRFDLPPRIVTAERRLAALAVVAWEAAGHAQVSGVEDNSLVIADGGAVPVIASCGAMLGAAFGLAAGMELSARGGLATELLLVCDLVRLHRVPAPFEARLAGHGRGLVLVRGVALPLADGGCDTRLFQVVLNWREALNRAATVRLQREIGAVLRHLPRETPGIDPFSLNSGG